MIWSPVLRPACATLALLALSNAVSPGAEPAWTAVVSPAGKLRFEVGGAEVGTLSPGLFEVPWQSASMGEAKPGPIATGNPHRGQIRAPGGAIVEVESQITGDGQDGTRCEYRLTPAAEIKLNSLHVSFELPSAGWAGGRWEADGRSGTLPVERDRTILHTAAAKSLQLTRATGEVLRLELDQPTSLLVQDDRQWGPTFSIRLGPQAESVWPAGKTLTLAFRLSTANGLRVEHDGPVTIRAGAGWLPLEASLDIEPGSALDFSAVIPREAPAGASGRVLANSQGHLAFAKRPGTPVRFYGVNLCFSALYPDHETADRLAERLWRLGYNAARIHHYESELVDRSSATGMRLLPDKLDRLDYLFAALKKRGIYLTTDLFVSRPVSRSILTPEAQGLLEMDEYKMAVHVNGRAYEDFTAFSRLLLEHVNPYTGVRYADDPALAWISLVNEDCPGNFIHSLKGTVRSDWERAWNQWLAQRYPDRKSLAAALGSAPDGQGIVPLQSVYGTTPATFVFNTFLAEIERDFFERTRRFLREEIRCEALLTDLNAWTNPVQMQAVRDRFDYVDDHFYVDHPEFIDRPWSLPSKCPNTSPLLQGATGGRACAFTRLFGKPFTITEFNYSSPGRFRGVGGILTGALGAVQDWDGIWRFAYSHVRNNLSQPSALNFFDLASDPLNLAAERASLCLFLRGDLSPAKHSVSIHATAGNLLEAPATSRDKTPSWHGLAWVTRVGWTIGDRAAPADQLALPFSGDAASLFAPAAGTRVLNDLRTPGWLPAANQTNVEINRFQSETGEVLIDAPGNQLTLDTPRTAGGFAPAGKRIETKAASIEILDTDATVWVSSLDGQPIASSRRLLVTHLTDLQNTGVSYADRARKILLAWGGLPHLVQAGRAKVCLRLKHPADARVFRLATSGKRTGELNGVERDASTLTLPLSVASDGKACLSYEIDVKD